jgi:type IV pilus assembly protein PilB
MTAKKVKQKKGNKSATKSKGKTRQKAGKRGKKPSEQVKAKRARNGEELIDMVQAIKILKTTRPTFYRWLRAGKVKGMKVGRQWRFYRNDIERFLKGEAPRVDLPADIGPLIETLEKRAKAFGWTAESVGKEEQVKYAVDLMLFLGISLGASDIHITSHQWAQRQGTVTLLQYRIDGVLQQVTEIDTRLLPAVVERFKYMAECDIREKVKPQDGRILVNFSELGISTKEKQIDLRVCFLPAALGEAVTVRILDSTAVTLDLDKIDYSKNDRKKIMQALNQPWGLILVTGPTGSGKTTVLYSCLNKLARPEIKIMTVEDPVEYILPWATQVQVRLDAGVTFEKAMRACLRSDPDVIMIGEIRNFETLNITMQIALTGHLVLSTLHTNEAVEALRRMVDIGIDPFVIADATKLILTQRLVRKLCRYCSVEEEPAPHHLEKAAELAREGGLDWDSLPHKFRKRAGCRKCNSVGYRGRTVIAETLEVTPEIGKALRNDDTPLEELREIAVRQGMTTMAADGIRRAANGETTLEEVFRVVR